MTRYCGRAVVLAAMLALSGGASAQATISVTDTAGRVVKVPAHVRKVFAAGPPASVFVLALAPDKLAGWTRALRPDEIPFLPPELSALPELGRLAGRGNTANIEVVMAAAPDLIIDIGSTAPTYVTLADRVTQTTGIPYVLFDGRLRDTPRLLRDLGTVLGVTAQAELLAREVESTLATIDARVARIPLEQRPRVFYARGANGLATAPRGSLQAEVLEIAGARNVAEPPPNFAASLYTVSVEQVLQWQPDVIVTIDPAFAAAVRTRPEWRDVPAVKNNRIYVAPDLPFGWVDAPPALNRVLGVEWLVRVLHPQLFPEAMGPRIVEFHRTFYHRVPTEAQVAALLRSAGLRK